MDDTTISEIIPRGQLGGIQAVVDDLSSQSQRERFKLNEAKCKELRISFAKNSQDNLDPIVVNNKNLEVIQTAKLLGLTISSNLKWNAHVSEIVSKAASRLFLLRQFKRACSEPNELLCFYRTCIRPVAEYACQAYHNSLPAYLSDDLERIQRRALRIIYPFCSYREALTLSGLTSLKSRRESLTTRLFKEILEDPNHNLHGKQLGHLGRNVRLAFQGAKLSDTNLVLSLRMPFIVNCKFLLCKSIMEPGVVYTLLIIVDFKECSHHFKLLSFYIFL